MFVIFVQKFEMYPLEIIKPMKEELTSIGFKDLTKSEDVNNYILNSKSAVLIVNSVCGCAAANARPGVISSISCLLYTSPSPRDFG